MKGKYESQEDYRARMKKLALYRVQNFNNHFQGKKHSLETRIKMSFSHRKEKNPNWKGGASDKNKSIRDSFEYKEWRKSVFERDNFTCVLCGQIGGKLNADHIKPFALFHELRFDTSNGRTLCVKCHRSTETYGWSYYHKFKVL